MEYGSNSYRHEQRRPDFAEYDIPTFGFDEDMYTGTRSQSFNSFSSATRQDVSRGLWIAMSMAFCMVLSMIGLALECSGLSAAMVVIGYKYLNDCPAEPYIPIYLMIAGSIGMLTSLCDVCIKAPQRNDQELNSNAFHFNMFIKPVVFGLTIAGMMLVYNAYGRRSDDTTSPNYCNATLYWFTVAVLALPFVYFLTIICLLLGVCLASLIASRTNSA